MESRLVLDLINEVIRFLRRPVIKLDLCPSEEVAALQLQIQDLMEQNRKLSDEVTHATNRYRDELYFNIHLQDLLTEHGIRWR